MTITITTTNADAIYWSGVWDGQRTMILSKISIENGLYKY